MLKPLHPLLANQKLYQKIIAPPYDVLSLEQALALGVDNPSNIVHLTRPEIDCPKETPTNSTDCYEQAKLTLQRFIAEDYFKAIENKAYLVYRISKDSWQQTGLMGLLEFEQSNPDYLKKHEHTRPDKVSDRANLLSALNTQISPVLLTYNRSNDLQAYLEQKCHQKAPDYSVEDDQQFTHQLWLVDDAQQIKNIEQMVSQIENFYIADGHHRCEAAMVASKQKPQILSVVFPNDELRILGYHRLIKDLANYDHLSLLEHISQLCELEPVEQALAPQAKREFGMYLEGKWYRLYFPEYEGLDIDCLHDNLIEPLLGISDPRSDKRIDFVGGENALSQIMQKVNSGEYALAFTLAPTSTDEVIRVADNKQVMPPKSTWFEPKLLDGFLMSHTSGQ
jgi:uncharacterized protein (DUF1015 family)